MFQTSKQQFVTLCEESVDWNNARSWNIKGRSESLSARRVWIEIYTCSVLGYHFIVTLCEESVDWNLSLITRYIPYISHSLRGECGLKSVYSIGLHNMLRHSLRGECGLKSLEDGYPDFRECHSLRGECTSKLVTLHKNRITFYRSICRRQRRQVLCYLYLHKTVKYCY